MSSYGGLQQPKDINTFAICAARCIDYYIATGSTCYGFDIKKETGECTIYTREKYTLIGRNGVDNYRRNTTCELPY